MASALCLCTLLLFLHIAGFCDATDYNILSINMAARHELWMAAYGRVYKSKAEKAKRFEIFKKNLKYIEDFNNAGGHTYTLGANQFTDLTSEEFFAAYVGSVDPPPPPVPEFGESHRSVKYETMETQDDVPSSVDWRNKSAVTPVKYQGDCGSCWAFAAVATIEGLIKIKQGVLFNLSEQQLVDCDHLSEGCDGGHPLKAYTYIIDNGGITTEDNYPYTAVEGKCDTSKANQRVVKITSMGLVRPQNEESLMPRVAEQPVAVQLHASDDWQHYKSGIFDGSCGTSPLNHEVTIVGYGKEGSNKYWIMKNSWNTSWGEDGYIRMKKDVDAPTGLCGLATYAVYPILDL